MLFYEIFSDYYLNLFADKKSEYCYIIHKFFMSKIHVTIEQRPNKIKL